MTQIPNRLPPAELPVARSADDVARWIVLWLFVLVGPSIPAILILTLTGVVPS